MARCFAVVTWNYSYQPIKYHLSLSLLPARPFLPRFKPANAHVNEIISIVVIGVCELKRSLDQEAIFYCL